MEHTEPNSCERITEVSYRLFRKHGISYITMDDIASELGMSKKTLYEQFKSKEEIIYHSIKANHEQKQLLHKQILKEAANVIEGMIALMQQVIREIEAINPVMPQEIKRFYPNVWQKIQQDHRYRNYRDIVRLLDKGKEQELFLSDINTDIVTKLFLVQVKHITDYDLFPISEYSRVQLFKHIFIHFIRGIATQKGQELTDRLVRRYDENSNRKQETNPAG